MNRVIFMGRLTRDPEVRYGGANNTAIARFSLAVDRRFKREGQPTADFFNCTAFGKLGEFVEKYLQKGTKIVLEGEIQNNNYKDKNGNTVYSMQIIANSIEFAESKATAQQSNQPEQPKPAKDPQAAAEGFMEIPDSIDEDELPFV